MLIVHFAPVSFLNGVWGYVPLMYGGEFFFYGFNTCLRSIPELECHLFSLPTRHTKPHSFTDGTDPTIMGVLQKITRICLEEIVLSITFCLTSAALPCSTTNHKFWCRCGGGHAGKIQANALKKMLSYSATTRRPLRRRP